MKEMAPLATAALYSPEEWPRKKAASVAARESKSCCKEVSTARQVGREATYLESSKERDRGDENRRLCVRRPGQLVLSLQSQFPDANARQREAHLRSIKHHLLQPRLFLPLPFSLRQHTSQHPHLALVVLQPKPLPPRLEPLERLLRLIPHRLRPGIALEEVSHANILTPRSRKQQRMLGLRERLRDPVRMERDRR